MGCSINDTRVKYDEIVSIDNNDQINEYCFTMRRLPWSYENMPNDYAYCMHQNQQSKMWIGDCGASCHFTNNDSAFVDWKPI